MNATIKTEASSTLQIPFEKKLGSKTGEFQRFEDKFLIGLDKRERLLHYLQTLMNPSYLDKDTQYTWIDSLYYDSSYFHFFQHHFMNLENRHKVRVRRYAPNGHWSDEYLLEVKRKIMKGERSETKKTRFSLPPSILESFKSGQLIPINKELCQINSHLDFHTLRERVDKVNMLIAEYTLVPILSVRYKRHAFESQGFRVTLDENLQSYEALSSKKSTISIQNLITTLQDNGEIWKLANEIWEKFSPRGHMILELKHKGTIPKWMEDILQELNVERTSFSKYCWFLMNTIRQRAC